MDNEDEFKLIEYEDLKIYIDPKLKLSDRIEINLASNLPLLGPIFRVKGVTVKK